MKIFSSMILVGSLSIFLVYAERADANYVDEILKPSAGQYRDYVQKMTACLRWLATPSSSGSALETPAVAEKWPQILERLDELAQRFSNPLRPLVKKVLFRYSLSAPFRSSALPIYAAENIGDSFGFQFKTDEQLGLGFNPLQTIDLDEQRLATLITNKSFRIRAIGYAILTLATPEVFQNVFAASLVNSDSFFRDLQDPSISGYEVARVLSRASLEYSASKPSFISSNSRLRAAIIRSLTQEYKRDLSLRGIDRPAGSILVRTLGVLALVEFLDPSSARGQGAPIWQLVDADFKSAFTNALLEKGESNSANYAWADLAQFPLLFERLVGQESQHLVLEVTLQKILDPQHQPRPIDGGWPLSIVPKLLASYSNDRQEFLLRRRDLFRDPTFLDLAHRMTGIAELEVTSSRELGTDGIFSRLIWQQPCSTELATISASGSTGTGKN